MLTGLSKTAGGKEGMPVPVKPLEPFTVPAMLNVALKLPTADGVKVRKTVHDELAAILPPSAHVPPTTVRKFVGFVPVIVK